METSNAPTPHQIAENLWLLNEMEPDDLFSLQAALQDDPDPALDDLWTLVQVRTGSLEH
jgi:hypothetical protein